MKEKIFAYCQTCTRVLAELDPKAVIGTDEYSISRRVVYESAQSHKKQLPHHRVMVIDRREKAKASLPN